MTWYGDTRWFLDSGANAKSTDEVSFGDDLMTADDNHDNQLYDWDVSADDGSAGPDPNYTTITGYPLGTSAEAETADDFIL